MNKKISLGVATAFMIVVAGITFCITMIYSYNNFNTLVYNVKEREEMYKKLADADRKIRQNYAGTINEDQILDSLAAAYVKGLGDKYSSYLTKTEYEYKLLEKTGKLVSIGVELEKNTDGYLKVTSVLKNSPAEVAAIQVDDVIISIDGADVTPMSLTKAQRTLMGEVGSKVTVVYRRDAVDETVELQRKDLDVHYVEGRLIGTNGYIKFKDFNSKTYVQFKTELDRLINEGATSLIFDMRNISNDSYESATMMLNVLLPKGEIGYKVDKDGNLTSYGKSDEYMINLPMAILVNSKTGSAAEFFSLVMSEFGAANTVGTQTMGKTVIQSLIPLNDGSAYNLTVAHYLPPSKTDITDIGITPDFEIALTQEQEQNFKTLDETTDPQLIKAIEVVNSKQQNNVPSSSPEEETDSETEESN